MSSTLYAALAATAFVVARPLAGSMFGAMAGWCGGLVGSGVQSATETTTTKAHPNATGTPAGKRITPGALGGRT